MSAAPSDTAVVVRDLVKRFGTFTAVDHVSFDVHEGEIMGFLGPNGAGKSTIIRILCALLRPTEGSAIVAGIDVARDPEGARQKIGYMSQKFSLYGDLTVAENLRFFGGVYRVPHRELNERIRDAIDVAGLGGHEDDLVATLAGGWKQRLALGAAILHRPPILFLDEPTSGVDPESRRRFWDLIHDLSRDGVSILVSTHYMDEAEYCDRIALIDGGRMIASGSPREVTLSGVDGQILVVECDALGRALEALQGAPSVRDVAVFGNALHVLVDAEANVQDVLASYLADCGIPLRRIAPIPATLEDAFVRLVTRQSLPAAVTP